MDTREIIDLRNISWSKLLWSGIHKNIQIDQVNRVVVIRHIDFHSHRDIMEIKPPYNLNLKVTFLDCNFLSLNDPGNKIFIVLSESQPSHFIFDNCELRGLSATSIQRLHLKNIKIDNLKFDKVPRLRIENLVCQSIIICDSTVVNDFSLDQKEIKRVTIQNSHFLGSVRLSKLYLENLLIQGSTFDNILLLKSLEFEDQTLVDTNKISKLSIQYCKGESFGWKKCQIKQLNVYRNTCDLNSSESTIHEAKISSNTNRLMSFIGDVFKGEVSFTKNKIENLRFYILEISNLTFTENTSFVTFNKVNGENFPPLKNNNFTVIELQDCKSTESWEIDFDTLDKIVIKNSKIDTISVTGDKLDKIDISESSEFELNARINKIRKFMVSDFESLKSHIAINECVSLDIQKSKIEKLRIVGKSCDGVSLISSNIESLELSIETAKWFKIRNMSFSKAKITNTNSADFEFINESDKSSERHSSLIFNDVNFVSCLIDSLRLDNLGLEKFKSKNLKVDIPILDEILIDNCNSNFVTIGSGNYTKPNKDNWNFLKKPKEKLFISNSKINRTIITGHEDEVEYSLTLDLYNNEFLSLFLKRANCKSIQIEGCIISNFGLYKTKKTELAIHDSSIDHFKSVDLNGALSINGSTAERINLSNANLSAFVIEDCNKSESAFSIGNLFLIKNLIKNVLLSDSTLQQITIKSLFPSSFRMSNLAIESLTLKDFEQNILEPTKFELNFINTLSNTKAKTLSFIDSNLSSLSFNSCYFGSFKELLVKSSKLDKINCTATTWPSKVTSFKGDTEKFEIREACRQLKLAMSHHQDTVNEIQFHALEMKAYKGIVYKNWKENKHRHWNDALSLLAGSSNAFGLNWFRPVLLIFLFLSLNYAGLIWSHFGAHPFTTEFWSCVKGSDYFQLFNPTHRTSQLSIGANVTGFTAFLDFFSKIISAFFLYQIVAAFRKFRRK